MNKPALDFVRLRRFAWVALVAYLFLILYGSLYPFSNWHEPNAPLFSFLTQHWPKYISSSDVAVNIIVYVPLGLLLAGLMRRSTGTAVAILVTTLLGALLSFSMESLQMFLPGRVSSVLDLMDNTGGTLFGAMLVWLVHPRTAIGHKLAKLRHEWLVPGAFADAGIFILTFAMLAELSPLIPSLRGPGMVASVAPLWQALLDTSTIAWGDALLYADKLVGLGLFAVLLTAPHKPRLRVFAILLLGVLAIKLVGAVLISSIPILQWRISSRAAIGLIIGGATLIAASVLPRRIQLWGAIAMILLAFVLDELAPGVGDGGITPFNWVPFLGQMYGFTGILDILASPTSFLVIGMLANLATPIYRRGPVILVGGIGVLFLSFALEFAQQTIPGRIPDVTDVILYSSGWFIAWLWRPQREKPTGKSGAATALGQPPFSVRRKKVLAIAALLSLLLVIPIANTVIELPLSDKYLPKLPAPEELPPVNLPGFRVRHPRLPAPTAADVAKLRRENPDFFLKQEGFAKRGDIYATILLARMVPGSQDLNALHRRLMDQRFVDRGDDQAKRLAVAYDWLYDQWSERQRMELQEKMAEGTQYITTLIRKDRLSPYNVYLYNAPFQGLMALSLALYKDHPQGEFALRFVTELWKNRTLPVWRQIMGKNGGWHEGGEYIALGIGQAVYELPAMWRQATGEDYIKSEPGIRGFMDFILYRLRPDGTHYRIGDANFSERIAQDLLPLALEFRDSAAYSIRPRDPLPVPSAWPWGPLTDPSLYDPQAVQAKPLMKLMDGIGIVVARSGWGPDATYVTFKAGDNYWSHSHLDQGSFTIFKGGPLAIDSGLYGTDYGTDHHMNYTYQSIAHNLITVTDPDDTVPDLTKHGERPIANDGGQRRIGSGWGIEPAPLDRQEWERKREIYHTGRITELKEKNGITIATADVTPAYTNKYSGHGTFSHRTRRVEKLLRTFGYDSIDDAVVIFDHVVSTKASFRKRWLLHSIDKPEVLGNRFTVQVPDRGTPGRAGGKLTAYVLLPERATLNAIGGPGMEFWIGDKNYDENGKVQQVARARKDPDVGAWRIEVSPTVAQTDDLFLTVLLPSRLGDTPPHRVKLLHDGNRIGCEIVGPHRTTRWWFDPATGHVDIEIAPL